MDFLEKDLEDIIFEAMQQDRSVLYKRGLTTVSTNCDSKFFRQPDFGKYGRPDIVEVDFTYGNVIIYELKKGKINIDTLLQASRYAIAAKRFLAEYSIHVDPKIILIGREIESDSDFVLLCETMQDLYVYTYSYDIDGISFSISRGWHITGDDEKTYNILSKRELVKLKNWYK